MAAGKTGTDAWKKQSVGRDGRNLSIGGRRNPRGSRFAYMGNLWENLFIVILALYPMRHIGWGLDLWDTGYNYANFTYMGMEHMDPMWLFSTYLANVTGWLLTKLPRADTLVGMNFYTGLFVTALALTGYFFCTRKLKIPAWIVFVGEFIAESLCWCPTALLYNYLTYVLFLVAVILLYQGLTQEKMGYLAAAGVCLGANVLVRFSNLPQMGLILAVWAYDVILWLEGRKGKGRLETGKTGTKRAGVRDEAGKTAAGDRFWPRLFRHTLWCLIGYLGALGALLLYLHFRYGIGTYAAGISRLFAMTENATDYTAKSMIMGVIGTYVENLYWVARMGVILAAGLVLFAVAGWLEERGALQGSDRDGGLRGEKGEKFGSKLPNIEMSARQRRAWGCKFGSKLPNIEMSARQRRAWGCKFGNNWIRTLHVLVRVLWGAVSVGMLVWLYARGFCSVSFYSYDPIWRPGPIFLMLAMFIGAVRIFHPAAPRQEKLISGLMILVILLTSLGSNNKVLPSLNNLFVAAPYTLWESWRFLRFVGERKIGPVILSAFPAKGLLIAFLALCMVQFGCFGARFAFAEATGIQDISGTVENNEVLQGVGMHPDKARWMSQISEYVADNDLMGREVILYGQIPSLAYYLQMPPAFNSWCDLASYSLETMREDLESLGTELESLGTEPETAWADQESLDTEPEAAQVDQGNPVAGQATAKAGSGIPDTEKEKQPPVVILENLYGLDQEGEVDALQKLVNCLASETGNRRQLLQDVAKNPAAAGYGIGKSLAVKKDEKWKLIQDFMEEYGYRQTYRNEKFAVYEME